MTKDPKQLFGRYSRLPLMLSSTTFSLCAVLYAKPLITPVAITCLIAYKYVKKPFGWGIRQVKSLPAKRNRTRIFVAHNICTYNMKTQERAFQDRLGTNKQKERPSLLTKECVFVRFCCSGAFLCVFVSLFRLAFPFLARSTAGSSRRSRSGCVNSRARSTMQHRQLLRWGASRSGAKNAFFSFADMSLFSQVFLCLSRACLRSFLNLNCSKRDTRFWQGQDDQQAFLRAFPDLVRQNDLR